MKKGVIIFDLDGVLFDSMDMALKYILDLYPGFTSEMQKELLCGNFHEEMQKIKIPKKSETEEERDNRKLLYSQKKSEVPMYPGAKDLLEELHQKKYILVLNTSAVNRNCLPLLEKNSITSLFDFLATAEISKSKVDKFKLIEEKYGLDKEHLLFVTDTLGDIREADVANISTIAVTWGAHDRDYFGREDHKNLIKVVDSFDQLREVIYNN